MKKIFLLIFTLTFLDLLVVNQRKKNKDEKPIELDLDLSAFAGLCRIEKYI